jgi:hypothetical protein
MVEVGLGVGVKYTVGVQVGGSITEVAVEVGISIVGGRVAGGNGLIEEVGLAKIASTTPKTISAASKTIMERISHTFSFMLSLPSWGSLKSFPFVSISDFEPLSSRGLIPNCHEMQSSHNLAGT